MKSTRSRLVILSVLSFCLGWVAAVAFRTDPLERTAPGPRTARTLVDQDQVIRPAEPPPPVESAVHANGEDGKEWGAEKSVSAISDTLDSELLRGAEQSSDPRLRALHLRLWLDRLVEEDALEDAWEELTDAGSDLEGLVAANYLGRHADPAHLVKLEDLHRDATGEDRWLPAVALFVAGREDALRDWAVRTVGTPPTEYRTIQQAVRRGGLVPSPHSRDVLIWAASSDSREVRLSVINAVSHWPDRLAREVALRLSNDGDQSIRLSAEKLLQGK